MSCCIGERILKEKQEIDRKNNGITFKFTKFFVNEEPYFAVEFYRQGWKGGKDYEIIDKNGNFCQSIEKNDKRIKLDTSHIKNRKQLIEKFKKLIGG